MKIKAQTDAARPDRSVLLRASAGSGKTHVLVRRIVHLLAAGAEPEDIVAATFSEKAAAQMRDRLYSTLVDAAGKGVDTAGLLELGPEDAPYPIVRTPEEILSSLSARPDGLRIGTIHALCLWLLRRFPLEAGLPPDFAVMDDSDITSRRAQAVDSCLDAAPDGGFPEEFATLADLGYPHTAVRELVAAALDKRPHIMKLAADAGGPEKLVENVKTALDSDTRLDTAAEFIEGRGLKAQAESLSAFLHEAGVPNAPYSFALDSLAAVHDLEGFRRAFGSARRFMFTKDGEPLKATPLSLSASRDAVKASDPSLKGKRLDEAARALKQRHDRIHDELRETLDGLAKIVDYADGARALDALLKLFFRAETAYTGSSRLEGLVDFDDIEIRAYELISGPGSAGLLSSVESTASHYLVDEFQDTGELQWGIIERLCSEAFSGSGAQGVDSPTVFAVGDEKQSIYRFRMANHRLMDRLEEKMKATIEPAGRGFPRLEHNFRSAPEVLRVVDETFGALFGSGYAEAVAFRTSARGSVTVRLEPPASESGSLAEEMEAALGLPVWDEISGGFRPAGYGDMAVLIRSRARLSKYEEALRDRGIPFKVVGGVGFFRQEEVRALVGILNYLDDPADTLSLACALKSPLFGISDGELEPVYAAKDTLAALGEVSPEAYRMFVRWRALAGTSTPGGILGRIIEETAATFVFGVHGGPSALLNVEKLAGIAREFDGAGLPDFTGWLRAQRDGSELAGADVDLPEYKDFASVMTAHAAKGLEFPVVFIAGTDGVPRGSTGRFLLATESPGDMAVYTDSLSKDNPLYGHLKALGKAAALDESKRLLYVAMTRAMDHLYVFAGCKVGKDGLYRPRRGSWAGLLFDAASPSLFPSDMGAAKIPAAYRYPEAGPAAASARNRGEAQARPGERPEIPGRLSPLPAASGKVFVSPSGLTGAFKEEPAAGKPYTSTLRGLALHRALELLGKTGAFDPRTACERVPGFSALTGRSSDELVEDVRETVSRLLGDKTVGGLLSPGAGRHFELGLLMEKDGDIVHGIADLVVVDGQKAAVYDFKSGLAGLGREEVRDAYAPQLEAYCAAVREAFGVEEAVPFILLVDTAELLRL